MNASLKGFLSENATAHELMARDFEVYKPIVDVYGCDFVICKNGLISKVQVRAASESRDGTYRFSCTHGSYGNIPYEEGMLDFFIFHLVDINIFYIIPFGAVNVNGVGITLNQKNKYYMYKESWDLLEA